MKIWIKAAAAATVVALFTGVGVAAALEGYGPGDDPGGVEAPPVANDLGAGSTESKYVAVQPCRIVDTRQAGGTIGNNQSRPFEVAGTTGFPGQGGKSGGCGIPFGATAVEMSLTIVSASGGGFMRVYPEGTSEPTATFINYSPYNPTNTGSVTLCQSGCGSGDLRVRGHGTGTTTHVVIEVQGYYAKPMAAEVNGSSVVRSSRLTSVTRTSAGVYLLDFDRDTNNCVVNATPYYNDDYISAAQATNGTVLIVTKQRSNNASADTRFNVEVVC